MKNHSSHNHDPEGLFSRRKMLSVLGVAGLSTVSTTVVARSQDVQKKGDKSTCFFYDNVLEMKQDRSLKEGDCIETKGYYEAGDGGHAKYQVVKSPEQKNDEGEFISLRGSLAAQLINVDKVNYRMFGAKSDGKNDDGVQIKATHDYANRYDIPVENIKGDFWIIKTNNIDIKTNVQWGKTIFHIDERYNSRTPRMTITGRRESIKLNLSEADKEAVVKGLKNKDLTIPALARYADSLMVIVDANDKIGARQGGNAHSARNKQDFFVVEEYGRILGDMFLEFKDYTSLTVYPCEKTYLTVEGGIFFLSGDSSELMERGYMFNGIQVTRSRTIIKNQWVGLEPGKRDVAMLARSGFYSFSRAYDVQLKNIRQIPYEKTRATKETTVPQGTYGISCNVVMNAVFSNVTAEGDTVHWGVFGTNYVKNFRIEGCVFNRFDVHSYGWNINIQDSHIGLKGITVTGGGELRIENSSSRGAAFISFRSDYGSRWDGDIYVRNCKYYAAGARIGSLLWYATRDVNYMYNIGYGHKIKIEDVEIDYEKNVESDSVVWLIGTTQIKSYDTSGKLFFPAQIELKNISVKGREKGVRIMRVSSPDCFVLPKKFSYDGSFLSCNARITVENVQLEQNDSPGSVHLSFGRTKRELEETGLVPFVKIKNCNNVGVDMGGNLAEVMLGDSMIDHVNLGSEESYKGALTFMNCKFRPYYAKDKVLKLDTVLGTSFVNCQLLLPQYSGTVQEDLLSVYGFMEINGKVWFNHLGTRLGQDLLTYLKNKGIQLTPEFIARLKAHHELEE